MSCQALKPCPCYIRCTSERIGHGSFPRIHSHLYGDGGRGGGRDHRSLSELSWSRRLHAKDNGVSTRLVPPWRVISDGRETRASTATSLIWEVWYGITHVSVVNVNVGSWRRALLVFVGRHGQEVGLLGPGVGITRTAGCLRASSTLVSYSHREVSTLRLFSAEVCTW